MSDSSTSLDPHPGSDAGSQYGANYYREYWGSPPYERSEHWLKFFGDVADAIVRDLKPASVLDAGCAMGFLVEALRARGVEAWGIDVSEYAISQVHESVREYCSVQSLTEPLPRRYDLITCIEVVEHVEPAETEKVIANLAAATDRLLLSTTPGDYGEPTHLNVQPPEFWSAALAREGLIRDFDHDPAYLSAWAALYVRRDEPLAETVRRYDRAWWRLRREVAETRESLLAMKDKLDAMHAGEPPTRSELLEEFERQKEELLRLRDLLIGKDAELGAIQGRITQLEEKRRFTRFKDRMETRLLAAVRRRIDRLRRG